MCKYSSENIYFSFESVTIEELALIIAINKFFMVFLPILKENERVQYLAKGLNNSTGK